MISQTKQGVTCGDNFRREVFAGHFIDCTLKKTLCIYVCFLNVVMPVDYYSFIKSGENRVFCLAVVLIKRCRLW